MAATISIVDDAEEEGNETIVVRARHGADAVGDLQVIKILANDEPIIGNTLPVFRDGQFAARSIAENTGPNMDIGTRLEARDVDPGDTLTYSLGGTDGGFFTVVRTSGQLQTRSGITYDHEARSSYRVTVSVSDGAATASIDVTIAVTDVDEPPDAPVVRVGSASPVSLNVMWLAPATPDRPAVSNYDVRYKLDSETTFIDGPQDVSGTSTTIAGLLPASSYDVQVRATNAEGDGAWSASQPGETAVLPAVTLILSASSIPEDRGMSTVTATVSPASPAPFSVEIWAAAVPPIPGQFETSLNNILSFAANATQSTGQVVITGLVATVVNVTGTVSPAGVLVKPPARVQLRITDVDPAVTVRFGSATYNVPEGGIRRISVLLDEDPERTVVIPITKTNQGGARSGDYSVDPDPTNVTFNAGGDLTQTFTFTATADTDDDDGESVLLSFGTPLPTRVSTLAPIQSTVSIIDDDDPEVTVKFGASSINVGEGDSATITVTISADPERTVVIPITKTGEHGATAQGETGADYSGVPNSVIFTASGSQTFTLTATQDRIDDDNEVVKLGFDTDKLPPGVTAESPTTQTINIGDDDKRGVTVTPDELGVNEDMSGTYTVVLDTQPTANVTVTPRTTSSEVTLSGDLMFTPTDWDTAQMVTVTAGNDADTVAETLTVTHTTRGGDYDMLATASVAVTLVDDDIAGVAINPSNLEIDEGSEKTFTVKLITEPGNVVTVTMSSRDAAVATVSDDSLTFTTGDWSTEQEVTVAAAQDDGAANNDTMITFGVSGYGSVTEAAPVTVTVEDDDERAVTISVSALTVEEEAATADPPTNTYTVVLDTQPEQGEGNVTVAITSDNDDIRTNGGSATSASPYNLTFTSTNWDQPQTVAVTAINDLDGWNEEATLTHAVSGADYGAVNAGAVGVTVTDNDLLGLRVSPAEYTTERVDVTEGTTYSYTLALLTVPLGDVTVDITSNNPDVTVDPTKLTILAAQWNAPHTVKITVAADADGEDEPATLSHTLSGYGTYTTGPDFLVQVLDRNEPGVFIEPTTLAITDGFTDAYSVWLRTEPSGTATVRVAGHAGTDVTVMPESLTFSSSDWNVPQAVTVTAAEDEDADNDTVTLTHTVSGYGTVTTTDAVTVTIVDRDEEGITVTDVTPPLEDPNEGDTPATGTYTIVLDTQPSGEVMVAITSNNPDVTVMPESSIFTTSDWNQSQTVTVTAAGDADATDDTATLTHKPGSTEEERMSGCGWVLRCSWDNGF